MQYNRDSSPPSTGDSTSPVRCIGCAAAVTMDARCRCPRCGDLVEVAYPAPLPAGGTPQEWKARWRARRASHDRLDQSGVWRFRELLPVLGEVSAAVSLREGNTPLYELSPRASRGRLPRLLAKHQGMNPTGSFKDTGMTVALSRAREAGFAWVGCASTGNTSASMAAYAARAGLRSLVLVPEGKITWSKLAQALDHGALTCQLRTDFDGCVRVLEELVTRRPVYVVNSVNPYRVEGQKTLAAELLEQLDWQVPDHVIVPGGNLAHVSALGKGFLELQSWGFIARLPRLSVVQAEGANPLVRALREHAGRALVPVRAETRATAIRIGNPASWKKALRVLRATGGACLDVSEGEIAAAKAALGREGIGCEPASAVTLAGAGKLLDQGWIQPQETVVLILTGHTLKDPEYTLALARGELGLPAAARGEPLVLEADAAAVSRAMENA